MNQTEAVSTITDWIEKFGMAVIDWTPKVVVALVILTIGYIAAKMVAAMMARGMRKASIDETLVRFLKNIVYMLLMAFVVIAALSKLGVNTTSLAAIFAAAGLAIGLALQNSLGNLAAGVMLIANRPFRVGDFVEVAGVAGTVEETSVFATILNTPDNKRLIVPNGEITAKIITNFSANNTRRVDMEFGVSYSDDLAKAQRLFREIVEAHPAVLKDRDVAIAVKDLADSSINIIVRPWVRTADYWTVWFEVTESIKNACDKEGLSIPFPQRDVHIYNEQKAA